MSKLPPELIGLPAVKLHLAVPSMPTRSLMSASLEGPLRYLTSEMLDELYRIRCDDLKS